MRDYRPMAIVIAESAALAAVTRETVMNAGCVLLDKIMIFCYIFLRIPYVR